MQSTILRRHIRSSEVGARLLSATSAFPATRAQTDASHIATADHPIINPNWLASETDQKLNSEAFKTTRALFNTTAVRSIITGPEVSPGGSVPTDEEILTFIQNKAATLYHASCACAVGRRNDSIAVIDSQARAIGVIT